MILALSDGLGKMEQVNKVEGVVNGANFCTNVCPWIFSFFLSLLIECYIDGEMDRRHQNQ